MNDLTRPERLQIMLTQEELAALDDWRFTRRMPSRAAAVRELLKRGLEAEGVQLAEGKMRSRDFGVVESPLRSSASGGEGEGA
jgi:metal-responsive CopG/Arc/MetJ family transcriptional regulator